MSLQLDPLKTALVMIDLQNGIAAMPVGPHPAADVVARAVTMAEACAGAGGLVVPVNVGFSGGAADRLMQPVDMPAQIPAGGPPPGWSDLVPPVAALPASFRITKRQWSAFHGTELDLQLRRRGMTTIVLCGISTNFGVESTAREGWQHNYAIVIAEDACTSGQAELHRFAIEKILPRIARVRSTAEIVAALRGH
ncbi:MAG TPA: hydrolase [Opitutaceae bacterium]|nr:hydrolase [Opitutaceae bacterium]